MCGISVPLTLCFAEYLTTVYEFNTLFTTETTHRKSWRVEGRTPARETEENHEWYETS